MKILIPDSTSFDKFLDVLAPHVEYQYRMHSSMFMLRDLSGTILSKMTQVEVEEKEVVHE